MSDRLSLATALFVGFASISGVASGDAILEYDTGHPLGPHVLDIGVETPLRISLRDTTGTDWPIMDVIFEFRSPEKHLLWDLDGPDDLPFNQDDDFSWESGLDDPGTYFATISPPRTTAFFQEGAVLVPGNGTVVLAVLTVVGDELGDWTLVSGNLDSGILFDHGEFPVGIENGSERVTISVVPEPRALWLLLLATLWVLRRVFGMPGQHARSRAVMYRTEPGVSRAGITVRSKAMTRAGLCFLAIFPTTRVLGDPPCEAGCSDPCEPGTDPAQCLLERYYSHIE